MTLSTADIFAQFRISERKVTENAFQRLKKTSRSIEN